MKPSSLFAALALISAPAHAEMFSMTCYPKNSTPYKITFIARRGKRPSLAARPASSGRTMPSMSRINRPNISYMWPPRRRDKRARSILHFDYSAINTDLSDIRVIDGASHKTDKCASDNFQAAALPTHESRSVAHEDQNRSIAHQDRRLLSPIQR